MSMSHFFSSYLCYLNGFYTSYYMMLIKTTNHFRSHVEDTGVIYFGEWLVIHLKEPIHIFPPFLLKIQLTMDSSDGRCRVTIMEFWFLFPSHHHLVWLAHVKSVYTARRARQIEPLLCSPTGMRHLCHDQVKYSLVENLWINFSLRMGWQIV